MTRRHPYSGQAWRVLRNQWAAMLPLPCARCGHPVTAEEPWHLDHLDPVALGGTAESARPAHQDCNLRAGVETRARKSTRQASRRCVNGTRFLGQAKPARHGSSRPSLPTSHTTSREADDLAASLGPDDECWRVPWLRHFLDIPADASWPRFMTRPHPNAVDSYTGAEFIAWSEARSGRPLRWWQRLAATRLLEHDAAGALVWLWVLLSTARQVGKSVLLGELALWRLHQLNGGPSRN